MYTPMLKEFADRLSQISPLPTLSNYMYRYYSILWLLHRLHLLQVYNNNNYNNGRGVSGAKPNPPPPIKLYLLDCDSVAGYIII